LANFNHVGLKGAINSAHMYALTVGKVHFQTCTLLTDCILIADMVG